MWRDSRAVYGRAWAFALACPLLFLIPAIAEAVQHAVEIRIGLYDGGAETRVAADSMSRLVWGWLKTLAILLPGYWFIRYMAWGNPARARALERPAIELFLVQFALAGALQALTLFGPGLSLVGLEGSAVGIGLGVLAAAQTVATVYLTAWLVAWPLGNAALGPVRSVRTMAGSFWRTIGYLLAGVGPLMVLHYALGLGAIGRPRGLVWTMMAADALVVGFLALNMAGSNFVAARHAAARKGVVLSG